MVSLTCTTDSRDGVTLVTARLDGGAVAQRVRVANRLDGPVWPPRRRGVPEAGWDDDGFTGVVPAEETVALGYASPAPPAESPLELVEREVVDEDAVAAEREPVTPADAVRELGDPSPPRDAVPVPVDGEPSAFDDPALPAVDAPNQSAPTAAAAEPEPSTAMPEPIAAWFDEVDRRITLAERLADAGSVPAATDALRAVESLDDAADLVDDVEDDAVALAAVAERAASLADRADEADVPLETFRRLA